MSFSRAFFLILLLWTTPFFAEVPTTEHEIEVVEVEVVSLEKPLDKDGIASPNIQESFITETQDLLSLENEFLKIIVNNQSEDQGRFSIETTKGSPERTEDDHKLLIFGRPLPWTSYTTFLIDKKPYVFGGKNVKVSKRSGVKHNFGEVLSQSISSEGIITQGRFDKITVSQSLSFLRNPSTKINDSVLISYTITNHDEMPHDVGTRIMLDTKLGDNDGAPFRIGEDAITAEIAYKGDKILDYWQAFDQLASPNIIAQGTTTFPEKEVQRPDRLYLVNWGTLVDHAWNFTYKKGRSFIRTGELDKDTALAMYWDPQTLGPGQSKTIRTVYGLGGLSSIAGELTIGLTAPAEIPITSKKDLLIIAYVQNSGGYDSENTKVQFEIPAGFVISEGKQTYALGTLSKGETRQIPLKIKLKNASPGSKALKVKVSSTTLADNEISRSITITGRPKLKTSLSYSKSTSPYKRDFVDVYLSLYNPNDFPLSDLHSTLKVDTGFTLPFYEPENKSINRLNPNKEALLHWTLKRDPAAKKGSITTSTQTPLTGLSIRSVTIKKDKLKGQVAYDISRKNIGKGQFFYIGIQNEGIKLQPADVLTLTFNPNALRLIRLSPEFLILGNLKNGVVQSEANSVVLKGVESSQRLNLFKAHFKALRSGTNEVRVLKNDIPLFSFPLEIK